jgi:hypothetical protein
MALGKTHQPALVADQALVDVVELLDHPIDARLVEPQRLHLGDDFFFQFLVLALLRRRERGALHDPLLGRQWLLLPALALEAIPGLGVLPFWLLVVASIASLGTPRPLFEQP